MPPGRRCDWPEIRCAATQSESGVGDGVGVGVPDGVGLGVPDGVGLGVPDGVGLGVPDGVGLGVPVAVGVTVGPGDRDGDGDGEPDGLGDPDGVGDPDGLDDSDGLPLGDSPVLPETAVRKVRAAVTRCPAQVGCPVAVRAGEAKAGAKTMLHARKSPAPSAETIMPGRGSAVGTASSVGFSGPRRTGRFGPFHLTRSPWRFPSLAGCRGRQAARRGIGGIPIMESRSPPRRLLGPWPCTDRGYVHIAWRGHE